MQKSGKLYVTQLSSKLRRNLSLPVIEDCDISMERFLTVNNEITETYFQNRDSDSLLGFEEGHPHSKNHTCSSSNGRHSGLKIFKPEKNTFFQTKIVSEYDQEITQSQTADNPVAPRGRAAQPS